jgi:hypothetical protein
MTRATPSDALLRHALLAYERLARAIDGAGDPELGLAAAFACGRRALHARAEAESWLVPPSVVVQIESLTQAMAGARGDEVGTWLDAYPNRLLALLERRAGGLDRPRSPRRRWVDRVSDGRAATRVLPSFMARASG